MSDDLEERLATGMRSKADSRIVADRWNRIVAGAPSPRDPRRRSLPSAPVLAAAAVIILGLLTAVVVSATRSHSSTDESRIGTRSSELSTTGSSETTTSVRLLTSDWQPGNAGPGALLQGTVTITPGGCVLVDSTVVIWPRNYSAVLRSGSLEVLDADGRPIARGGDTVAMGGGYSDAPATGPCQGVGSGAFAIGGVIRIVGRSVPLPTSSWRPGAGGMQALVRGALQFDQNGCIAVGGVHILWPAGWTARTAAAGVEILDDDGRVVAHSDQVVEVGGGYVPLAQAAVTTCTPAEGSFTVMSDVTVTG